MHKKALFVESVVSFYVEDCMAPRIPDGESATTLISNLKIIICSGFKSTICY